ncbi:hypothetical protein Dimus_009947 [Dionaea muscipula]
MDMENREDASSKPSSTGSVADDINIIVLSNTESESQDPCDLPLSKRLGNTLKGREMPKDTILIVNRWIAERTNGLLEKVVSADLVDCDSILIAAIIFNFDRLWDREFNKSETQVNKFHINDSHAIEMPFLTSNRRQLITTFTDFKR